MPENDIQRIVDEMPSKEKKAVLARTSGQRLSGIAAQLDEDLLAVASVVMAVPLLKGGTLVVTPTRLVVIEPDGGTTIVQFADVQQMTRLGGQRKVLGGYQDLYLYMTRQTSGAELQWVIGRDGAWANRCVEIIMSANQASALGRQ